MKTRYIGITDFMTRAQVRRIIELYYKNDLLFNNLRAHIGVMMSRKTLGLMKNKWTDAFPKREEVSGIFMRHLLAFNVLHYADYDGVDVFCNLLEAADYGGPNMDAMQLDMIWPSPVVLRMFRDEHPEIQLILQIGANALAAMQDDPTCVAERLAHYDGDVDYVLLDKSMGKGLGMDARALLPFVRRISQTQPHIGIAVAGGLGPNTLNLVEPIVREFPDISIDAQGRLRPNGDALNEPIDWNMAEEYFLKAYRMLQK